MTIRMTHEDKEALYTIRERNGAGEIHKFLDTLRNLEREWDEAELTRYQWETQLLEFLK